MLPLPTAAAVSTGSRVHEPLLGGEAPSLTDDGERAGDVCGVAMVLCAHVEQREVARAHLPAVGPARVTVVQDGRVRAARADAGVRHVPAAAVGVGVVLEEALELILHRPRRGGPHHLGVSHRAHPVDGTQHLGTGGGGGGGQLRRYGTHGAGGLEEQERYCQRRTSTSALDLVTRASASAPKSASVSRRAAEAPSPAKAAGSAKLPESLFLTWSR